MEQLFPPGGPNANARAVGMQLGAALSPLLKTACCAAGSVCEQAAVAMITPSLPALHRMEAAQLLAGAGALAAQGGCLLRTIQTALAPATA